MKKKSTKLILRNLLLYKKGFTTDIETARSVLASKILKEHKVIGVISTNWR